MKTKHTGNRIDIDEQKRIELEILQYIVEFCTKNDIKCSIAYGSLIGAIRHDGFIPWDDDIDILMLREDYERFRSLFLNSETDKYYLIDGDSDKKYPFPFMKICDNRTILYERNMNYSFNGIYVDIFPLDHLPVNEKKWANAVNKLLLLHNLMGVKIRKRLTRSTFLKTAFSDILYIFLKIIPLSVLKKAIKLQIHSLSKEPSEFVGNITTGAYIRKERFDVQLFNKMTCHQFENILVPIPEEYDTILHKIYGDYMQLPPEEKRVFRHGTECFWKDNEQL